MLRRLANWRIILAPVGALKIILILTLPLEGDTINWIKGASLVSDIFRAGKLPSLSVFGPYLGIEILLVPFFVVWRLLPIEHPALDNLPVGTASSIYLALLMKLPILLFDVITALLLMRLLGRITKSETKRAIAGISWFANPFNVYWLYVYGAMDVIPAATFLLALTLGLSSRWFRCGFTTVIGGFLRLFPFVALPFFTPLTNNRSSRIYLLLGSIIPPVCLLGLLYATGAGTLASIVSLPTSEPWLLDFLGFNIAGRFCENCGTFGSFVFMTAVLVLIQFYVVLRYWKAAPSIVHLATVSLLTLSLGATTYGGSSQHFIWVTPLLSACVALHPEEAWIFVSTFVAAYLSPAAYPFSLPIMTQARRVVDPFLAGAFYAMKAIYLAKLNSWNMKPTASHQIPMKS
jgi:hypothetical protein